MSKQPEQTAEIEKVRRPNPFALTPDREKPPVKLSDIVAQMGISGPQVPAEELVDQTFTILKAKSFDSAFAEDRHAYFCAIAIEGTGEIMTTVLGGQAVVDIIDALSAAGLDNPLTVTLRHKTGGKYNGYYVLE